MTLSQAIPILHKSLQEAPRLHEAASESPWKACQSGHLSAVIPKIEEDYPATVRRIYYDDKGRRCTQFIATANGNTLRANEDAALIAFYRNGGPVWAKALLAICDTHEDWCERCTPFFICRYGKLLIAAAEELERMKK